MDIIFLFNIEGSLQRGIIILPGINMYSDLVSPFEEWISGINLKALLGRSLFQQTHADKGEFIKSMFKKRGTGVSPLRIRVKNETVKSHVNDYEPVKIEYQLTNISWMSNVTYVLRFDSTNYHKFYFIGETAFDGILQPLETKSITMEVVFPFAGVFDLNAWKLTARIEARLSSNLSLAEHRVDSEFTQYPTSQQLITVK